MVGVHVHVVARSLYTDIFGTQIRSQPHGALTVWGSEYPASHRQDGKHGKRVGCSKNQYQIEVRFSAVEVWW